MGLDMYLYRCTKGRFSSRRRYLEASSELWARDGLRFTMLPRKPGTSEYDFSRFDEDDKEFLERFEREKREIEVSTNYKEIEKDAFVRYWRKFNALHGFIMDTFAGGDGTVDGDRPNREVLIGGREGAAIIANALKITLDMLSEGKVDGLPVSPRYGPYFGSMTVNEEFRKAVKEAYDVFVEQKDSLADNEVLFYVSSY